MPKILFLGNLLLLEQGLDQMDKEVHSIPQPFCYEKRLCVCYRSKSKSRREGPAVGQQLSEAEDEVGVGKLWDDHGSPNPILCGMLLL